MDRLGTLETFVCVVECGSFSAASKRLGIGQPAISKAIMQLERQLSVTLLLRSTRGLTPTEAGQQFYEHIAPAINMIREAEDRVRHGGTQLSGRLRICAPVTFARLHIMPRLHEFMSAHPHLKVDMILDDRPVDLIAEGIDISLRLGALKDSGLTARRIDTCSMRLLATPEYFSTHGTPHSPDEVTSHDAVVYLQADTPSRWQFSRGNTQSWVTLAGRIRVSAAEGVRTAVLAGDGLAVASEWMFAPELADGRVVTALDDWHIGTMDLWAVYPGGRLTSARARAFTDFVAGSVTGVLSGLD
ncbi:LysR family transcriptional regulator [Prodigiosinella confusarubida]|uniref:LysR family transcriptional regulator n=1 Tax=Serratia sp. (strain ATCC 39006) TaxID=104623 RepID=A0A2I5TEN3_SERS3|nr:LysR family transcriptional regulator [Serratia sp. ATCC 39006]AUG98718.1 LysR family transcriptional regulator [Serratia sp. ATCC 39006]AUH03033.1 LysR family transcriptional regulator [Serratia sp. ATCC 39006]